MSIAVNVKIVPSLSLPVMKAGALSAMASSLVWIVPMNRAEIGRFMLTGAMALFFLAFSLRRDVKKTARVKTIRISPSGLFHIDDGVQSVADHHRVSTVPGEAMQLQPDSTLWPFLLLLVLKTAQGRKAVILITKADMSGHDFRRLQVACRWTARHNDPAQNVTN